VPIADRSDDSPRDQPAFSCQGGHKTAGWYWLQTAVLVNNKVYHWLYLFSNHCLPIIGILLSRKLPMK